MKSADAAAEINASPDAVWAILTDAPGYRAWDSGVERVEQHRARQGKIKVLSKANPGRAFPVKVTEFTPGQRMTWSGSMPLGLFKGVRTFTLAPGTDGTTRFTMRGEYLGRSCPDLALHARPGALVPAVRQRPEGARRALTALGYARPPGSWGPLRQGKALRSGYQVAWPFERLTRRTRAPPTTRASPASSIGPELAPVKGGWPSPEVVLVAAPTAAWVVVVAAAEGARPPGWW